MTRNYETETRRLQGLPAQRHRGAFVCVVALSLFVGCNNAIAKEKNSPIPFEVPKHSDFLVPDRSSVIPEVAPAVIPERTAPDAQKDAPPEELKAKPKKSKKSKPPVADSAPAATESAPTTAASAAPASAESATAAPASAAPVPTEAASAAPVSTEPVSGSSGKRYMLQGKTEVIDFKLSEFDDYKQGMAALDKRDFAGAVTLFKAAAAKLDEGHEPYRAECNFFEAKALMMQGKVDQALSLLKAGIALFDKHDPRNPYKLAAQKMVGDLLSGKGRMDNYMLQGRTNMQRAAISVDQNIMLLARAAADDSDPILLRAEKEATKTTIHDCFAQMTCLETAEIGSNVYSADGRWQPLLVKGEPAALEFGAKPPVINVKINGQLKEVSVNLPMLNGLRRILLATDGEKVAAIDVDNNDTWLLLMDVAPDGNVGRFRWALLRHAKQKSATWGVAKGTLNLQRPKGNTWGTQQYNGFGKETGFAPKLYRNSQGKY